MDGYCPDCGERRTPNGSVRGRCRLRRMRAEKVARERGVSHDECYQRVVGLAGRLRWRRLLERNRKASN